MSYLAILSFDLTNATSKEYDIAYEDLKNIGLEKTVTGSSGREIRLPTTTCAGVFNGQSATEVRDNLLDQIEEAFKARGFESEIFVSVGGGDWTWVFKPT